MNAKGIVLVVVISFFATLSGADNKVSIDIGKLPPHPRILLCKGAEKALKKQAKLPVWNGLYESILQACDTMLGLPVNERVVVGRRLLATSRENLRRILFLGFAYRMTGEKRYSDRAEAEMLKAASFSDWNPSHFLDVAEMTAALAIGYDWLYPKLSETSRRTIRTAILEKGLKPSFGKEHDAILNAPTNWNQVCHCGMAYGALAVAETEPDLARRTIERAVEKVRIPMRHYAPDGAYPEGYAYMGIRNFFQCIAHQRYGECFRDGLRVVRCSPVFWSPGNSCCTWSLRSCVRSVIPIAAPTQDCSRLCFGFTEKRETHRFFAIRAGYYRRTAAKITCKTGCSRCCSSGGRERRSTNRPCRKPYIGKAAAIIPFF